MLEKAKQKVDLLVRFENHRTLVLKVPSSVAAPPDTSANSYQHVDDSHGFHHESDVFAFIKKRIGSLVGWFPEYLEITHFAPPPFATVE